MTTRIDLDDLYTSGFNRDLTQQVLDTAYQYGADDFMPPFFEYFNDQDGNDTEVIVGRDFSDTGEGLTEYWIDTQESRYKVIRSVNILCLFDTTTAIDPNEFGAIAGGLTNGIVFFWDRVFDVDGSPVIVRLFSTDPVRTNADLIQFSTLAANPFIFDEGGFFGGASAGKINVIFDLDKLVPIRIRNLEDVGGTDPISDRVGVVLNDDFSNGAGGISPNLTRLTFKVNGFSIFKSGSILG